MIETILSTEYAGHHIIARYTALDHVEGYVARWRTEPRVLITVTPEHIATRSGPTLRHDALRCPGP